MLYVKNELKVGALSRYSLSISLLICCGNSSKYQFAACLHVSDKLA
ncbi:MAG: hypothetical protein MJ201_05295 [Mycoplasmoidaceae bacterium]|nr:hypothetical protein [Mycoplasmoidaceae bacterium]